MKEFFQMQTTVKLRKPDMPISKDKVKDMISILELSQRYSPKIRENVRRPLIICPFHQDKNLGACRIYTDTNTFKCESCGAHGDMLKLASGYLGIPTSNMNELLEKLISEFGIIRENVLVDYTPGTKSKLKPIERLSPEEYKELLHEDHFKVPCKYSELDYGDGEIDYVPCEYTTYYYRTLAVKDPKFHDWVICTVSRIYWLRYSQMLNFCQCNGYSLFADVIENKLKLSLNLLLKGLTNKSLYRPELKLRNELLAEELSLQPLSA